MAGRPGQEIGDEMAKGTALQRLASGAGQPVADNVDIRCRPVNFTTRLGPDSLQACRRRVAPGVVAGDRVATTLSAGWPQCGQR